MLPLARQKDREVVMGRGEVRVERDGALKALQRLALSSDGGQQSSQIGMGPTILEREAHGLAGVRERLIDPSERPEHRSARSVASRERLIERKRAIAGAQSFFFPPERVQCLREIEENRNPVRLQLQGAREQRDAFRGTFELSQRHTEQLQEVGIIRATSQQSLVARDCLAQAAGTMVANRTGKTCSVGAVQR